MDFNTLDAQREACETYITSQRAERIRDKFAASKKKGMWMGGIPPLGYGRSKIKNGGGSRI